MWTERVIFNQQIMPLDQVAISPLDSGFLFGHSVYEVIPVYQGHLFCWPAHWQRLQNSLQAAYLPLIDGKRLAQSLQQLIDWYGQEDMALYVQITAGAGNNRQLGEGGTQPTELICAMALPAIQTTPLSIRLLADERWQHCYIKTTALLANILVKKQVESYGAVDGILHRHGFITESSAANVFIVVQGCIVTPPLSAALLAGVTRKVILKLAADLGLHWQEKPITCAQLLAADEVWLASSTKEIRPVGWIDQQPIGKDQPGPVYQQLQQALQRFKETPQAWTF